ncbi:MAG: tRNA (adenosine(37)-N6)-dimethylallyltransferase MiaA [Clostridiales bacterium]|nr:tRNA (adenosine(37)-N6)-dimethylallyltransferase MiaA [Clostridiales bacterium]
MAEFNKVFAIIGPTASGKTALGVELCRNISGEVVSCDSMQIYKAMDIATAKPSPEEMKGIKHHLIGFVDKSESFSVSCYQKTSISCIKDILQKKVVPVIVGGTGLYFDSLYNYDKYSFARFDSEYRCYLEDLAEKHGAEFLYNLLCDKDIDNKLTVNKNDVKRIIRALEIIHNGYDLNDTNPGFDITPVLLDVKNRDFLYKRINDRVDRMLENGLIDEAKEYYLTYSSETSTQAIGYKEIKPYLDGIMPLDECAENLKKATRNYAKRQLSWFHRYKSIKTFHIDEYACFDYLVSAVTEYFTGVLNEK